MSEEPKQLTYDKSTWGEGPWQHEPDRLEWVHAGYACLLNRHPVFGNLCGYVGVDEDNRLYGKHYNDVPDVVRVHGGVTYSASCEGHICHVPQAGMPDQVWWFGFDCAHHTDLTPGMPSKLRLHGTYRDLKYVVNQINSLAEQLRVLAKRPTRRMPKHHLERVKKRAAGAVAK